MTVAITRNDNEDQTGWMFDLGANPSFLNLPNKIMEMICRHLTRQGDRHEMCLVHPVWSTAAWNVLWEEPEFHTRSSFRLFCKAVAQSRRSAALAVRKLNLCLLPCNQKNFLTLFLPIAYSDEHQQVNVLAKPSVIMELVRRCERLTSLTIYGWHLNAGHLHSIASNLRSLESLHIIGSSDAFALTNSLVMRLKRLILDCSMNLSTEFVHAIGKSQLCSLQISLRGVSPDLFDKLIQALGEQMTDLTLTHTENLHDEHVSRLAQKLPRLSSLCLDSTQHLSARALEHIIMFCSNICHLEIRGITPTKIHCSKIARHHQDMTIPRRQLQRLILKNLDLYDDDIIGLSRHCQSSLAVLGISNCRAISDQSVSHLLDSLHTLHIIECSGISGHVFRKLPFIQEVHFESSGPVSPQHVYTLCCSDQLKLVRMVNYPDIANSPVGGYSIERPLTNDVTLDSTAIDALIQEDNRENVHSKGTYLSDKQLVTLAKQLHIPVSQLELAIQIVESATKEEDSTGRSFSMSDKASCDTESEGQKTESQIEEESDGQACHGDSTENLGYISPVVIEKYQCDTTLLYTTSTPIPGSKTISSGASDAGALVRQSPSSEFATVLGDLGGWGYSNKALSWMKTSSPACVPKPSLAEECEKYSWQQVPKTASYSPPSTGGGRWGVPKEAIPWLETQGFVHDVIEKQKNTVYKTSNTNSYAVREESLTDQCGHIHHVAGNLDGSGDFESRAISKEWQHGHKDCVADIVIYPQSSSSGYDSGSYAGSSTSSGDESAIPSTYALLSNVGDNPATSALRQPIQRKIRHQSRRVIPPDQMPGRWGDFADYAQAEYQEKKLLQQQQPLRQQQQETKSKGAVNTADSTDRQSVLTVIQQEDLQKQSSCTADTETDYSGIISTPLSFFDTTMNMKEPSPLTTDNLLFQLPKTDSDDSDPSSLSRPSSRTSVPMLGKKVVLLEVETEKYDKQMLVLYENQAVEESVRSFCDQYDMDAEHSALLRRAKEEYTKYNTSRLLTKKKPAKSKQRTSQRITTVTKKL